MVKCPNCNHELKKIKGKVKFACQLGERKMNKKQTLSDKIKIRKMLIEGINTYDVKEFIPRCFKRMEKRLKGNMIKYQDVVLIIREEAGPKLVEGSGE